MYTRRCRKFTWRRTSADDSRSAAAVYGVDDGSAARSLTVVGRSCRLAAFLEGPPFSGPAFSGPAFSAPPSVGAGSDHLQLIKFWRSCAPGGV